MTTDSISRAEACYLVVDSGSPVVSVALGRPGELLASRSAAIRGSSELLLAMIDEVLREQQQALEELAGLACLRGPGSFTGLRVGLATVAGLHLASGVPATGLETLDVLALQASRHLDEGHIAAVVDAQRDEWTHRIYRAEDLGDRSAMETTPLTELAARKPDLVVGFGCSSWDGRPARLLEPTELAPTGLDLLAGASRSHAVTWRPELLYEPIYSRPPAVSRRA